MIYDKVIIIILKMHNSRVSVKSKTNLNNNESKRERSSPWGSNPHSRALESDKVVFVMQVSPLTKH